MSLIERTVMSALAIFEFGAVSIRFCDEAMGILFLLRISLITIRICQVMSTYSARCS